MTHVIEPVPEGRRQFLSLLTTGAISGSVLGALYPVVNYFIPPRSGSSGDGVPARDRAGKPVAVQELLAASQAGDYIISQGISYCCGAPTYIVIDDRKQIANFGLNAVCPHLGCVVPWDAGLGKFHCPCHGSEYDKEGGLTHGPSGKPLALVKAEVQEDKVNFSPWTAQDFRKTSLYSDPKPWWI